MQICDISNAPILCEIVRAPPATSFVKSEVMVKILMRFMTQFLRGNPRVTMA